MQKRLIREKRDKIPKTFSKKVARDLRDVYNYLRNSTNISPIFYFIRIVFLFYESTLPSYFPMDKLIWIPGRVTTRIMEFLSAFTYFGAMADSTEGLIISFIVLAFVYLLIFVMNMIASLTFKMKGKLDKNFMKFLLFLNDIVFTVFCSYGFAQIGAMIGQIAFVDFNIVLLIGIFVIMFLVTLDLVILCFFYFPSVIYDSSSSICWIAFDNILICFFIGFINLFSRISEKTPDGPIEITFRVIFISATVISFIYFCFSQVFLNIIHNVILRGVLFGDILIAIVQTTEKVDQDIVFIFSIILLVLSVIIEHFVAQAFVKGSLNQLELILDDTEDPNDPENQPTALLIKHEYKMITIMRNGILFAHPSVTSLKLFKLAIIQFPKSKVIWEQYLRFVAIYPEENLTLMTILEQLKIKFPYSQSVKTMRQIAAKLLQSRNKHMSTQLKRKLREFDEYNRTIKITYISYWSALQEGSAYAVYDISKQIMKQNDELKSEYMHQLTMFPNNWILCNHYSKSLKALYNNQIESEFWSGRAQLIRKSEQIADKCRARGLVTFPNLPIELHPIDENHNRYFYGGSVASKSQSLLSSSKSSASAVSQIDDITLDDDKITVSENIRLMGLRVPISFISQTVIFTIVMFLLFGLILPFMPTIPYLDSLTLIQNYWEMIESATTISYASARLHYFLVLEAGRNLLPDIFISVEEDTIKFNVTTSEIYYASRLIPEVTLNFSTGINNLLNFISENFEDTGTVAQSFFTSSISVYYPDSSELKSVSIPDSLSYISSQLFGYDNSTQNTFMNESWFQFIINNIMSISDFMISFSQNLFYAIARNIQSSYNLTRDITIACDVILFLISLIFYPLVYRINKKWNMIVNSISKLPKSSIHQAVASFSSKSGKTKISDGERLYISEFMQMATSRDSHGGIPVVPLSVLFAFFQVLCIFSTTLVFFTTASITERLMKVPMRFIVLRDAESTLFYTSSLMNLVIALSNGTQIANEMSYDYTINLIQENRALLSSKLSNFLIGTGTNNYGLMSDDDEVIRQHAFTSQSFIRDGLTQHDYLTSLPDMIFVNSIHQYIEDTFVSFVDLNVTNGDDNHDIVNHFMEQHLDHIYDQLYTPPYINIMNTNINNSLLMILLLPVCCIVVELILIVCIIVLLNRVRNTIRFCLSTLSFIDSFVVTQSQEISHILSNQFNFEKDNSLSSRSIINNVPDFSSEVIVMINRDKKILYINNFVEKNWNLKSDECVDVDVDLIFRFDDEQYQKALYSLFKNSIKSFGPLKTNVVIVTSETRIPVTVSLFPVMDGKDVKNIILVITDLTQEHQKLELLEKEKNEARTLQLGLYPKSIRSSVDLDKDELVYICFKRVTLIAVQLSNINEILKEEDPPGKLTIFRNKINEAIKECKNGEKVKSLGSYEFIMFNMNGNLEVNDTIKSAVEYCQKVCDLLKDDGLQAQFGLTSETKCPMGMIDKNHMSFDVFGRCMHTGKTLCAAANPNSLCIDVIDVNSFQSIHNGELTQKEITTKGTKFKAFEYSIVPNV